jgi:hypothetical protein
MRVYVCTCVCVCGAVSVKVCAWALQREGEKRGKFPELSLRTRTKSDIYHPHSLFGFQFPFFESQNGSNSSLTPHLVPHTITQSHNLRDAYHDGARWRTNPHGCVQVSLVVGRANRGAATIDDLNVASDADTCAGVHVNASDDDVLLASVVFSSVVAQFHATTSLSEDGSPG